MKRYYINPHLFFLVEKDSTLLVWNYDRHEQYTLESSYFEELCAIAKDGVSRRPTICDELRAAALVLDEKPTEEPWGWDALSKIFHLGTQNSFESNQKVSSDTFIANYLLSCDHAKTAIPTLFTTREGETIALPQPNIDVFKATSFYEAIQQRKTCREFTSQPIGLQQLSNVLFASFGLLHGESWDEFEERQLKQVAMRKASPASGGVHVEEAYVVVYRVAGLTPGLYHYQCRGHRLTRMKSGDFEDKVIAMNFNQFYAEGLSLGIYVTARFDKLWWKYRHSRSYRTALLDVGHVSQTFLLAATACGLSTWITAAFQDKEVDSFLRLTSHESALLYLGAGIGTGRAFPDSMYRDIEPDHEV